MMKTYKSLEKSKQKINCGQPKQHRLMGNTTVYIYSNDQIKDFFVIRNNYFESFIIIHRTFIEFYNVL